ncbi:MAG: ABC transporter ATP-binding protein [Cyanobacteriota bacterium]|nr:ABC transporter ATP-binding protein [Cyanobacteriota bacterium]
MSDRDNGIPAIELHTVSHYFGSVKALDQVSLRVEGGEFFTLLGPSGSGKTTCLRLIAGFERLTTGSIKLYGQEVSALPPYARDVNTVFQDYALFPHMTVAENVGYGLMIKGIPQVERRARVQLMLELIQLPDLGERRPAQLSGGQRQRVALARALINQPRVLLLDEPLAALDLKLRQQMQSELKSLQQKLGITFIFVTHDQEEALTMSDRIAVFEGGKIAQVGSPSQIYDHPATLFVANFIGVTNHIAGSLAQQLTGSPQPFCLRPEKIRLAIEEPSIPDGWCHRCGILVDIVYLGVYTRYQVLVDEQTAWQVVQQNSEGIPHPPLQRGQTVHLLWSSQHHHYLPDVGDPWIEPPIKDPESIP